MTNPCTMMTAGTSARVHTYTRTHITHTHSASSESHTSELGTELRAPRGDDAGEEHVGALDVAVDDGGQLAVQEVQALGDALRHVGQVRRQRQRARRVVEVRLEVAQLAELQHDAQRRDADALCVGAQAVRRRCVCVCVWCDAPCGILVCWCVVCSMWSVVCGVLYLVR